MFRTKSEVDKHVGRILMRAKSSSERNKESLKIASLYFDVKDYDQAEFYLVNYISEFSQDPSAWELRGKLDEALMDQESSRERKTTPLKSNLLNEAIESYSRAYSLGNNTDHNLLLNICGCLLKKKDGLDINQAKEWLSSAEKHFPFHSIVVKLKEKLHTMLDSSTVKSEEEVKDWESFLIKAINENVLSDELHLKLIKIYIKNKNYTQAVRHFLMTENKSLFINSPTSLAYYSALQSLIENEISEIEIKRMNFDYEETESNNYNFKLLCLINLILLERVMLVLFQSDDDAGDQKLYKDLFSKYNKCLSEYEKIKAKLINYDPRSSFFFLTGTLLLKLEKCQLVSGGSNKIDFLQQEVHEEFEAVYIGHSAGGVATSGDDSGPNWLSNTKLISLFCFLQSIMTSDLARKVAANEATDPADVFKSLLVKIVKRESCWRYSIVGRWFKFIIRTYYANDQIEFFKRIRNFSLNSDVRAIIQETAFGSSQQGLYFHSLSDSLFKIEDTKSNFIDNTVLEMADKSCLESQTFNLKFLIWHCLVNTKFEDPSKSSSDLNDSIPPNFYFKIIKQKMNVKYGVENLGICNVDSMCVLDLKVFLYSCVFQAVSYLRNRSTQVPDQFFVEPFWLQQNLCDSVQSEWWYFSTNYLFKSGTSRKSLAASSSKLSITQLEDINDPAVNLAHDATKLNQLTKIIELIRLKSSQVSIQSEFRYKLNVRILINVANYLQHVYDNQTEQQSPQDNSESILGSPRQKQTFLKQYLVRYWQYLIKHLVKLKQIVNLDETTDEDQISLDQLNIEFIDLSLMSDTSHTSAVSKTTSLYDDLFKFYSDSGSLFSMGDEDDFRDPRRLSLLVNQQKSEKANYNDLVIKNGILNLILLNMKSLYESVFPEFDEEQKIKKLNESLEIFDLIEKSINEKTRYQLSSSQLKICKEIGELLIDQRNQAESEREKQVNNQEPISKGIETVLEKIAELIQCLKKMLKAVFDNKREDLSEKDQRLIANLSTPKKQIVQPPIVAPVAAEVVKEPEVVVAETVKPVEEVPAHTVQIPTVEKEEIELNQSKEELDKTLNAEEEDRVTESVQAVKSIAPVEAETVNDQEAEQQNKKMQDLIEILTKQKIKHFELNVDTMREQFGFIKSQFKQMNNEINYLSQRNQRRRRLQEEFADLVKDFHHECDVKSFNTQFNVFYWLFQQNPNLSEMFLKQSKEIESEMVRMSQLVAANKNPVENISPVQRDEPQTPPARVTDNINTSAFDYKTPPENKQTSFLGQSIGELNFMSNSNQDIADQLKNSVMSFKKYQEEEEEVEASDEEYGYEDYDDEEVEYDQGDASLFAMTSINNASRQNETSFLSCEDYSLSFANKSTDSS